MLWNVAYIIDGLSFLGLLVIHFKNFKPDEDLQRTLSGVSRKSTFVKDVRLLTVTSGEN